MQRNLCFVKGAHKIKHDVNLLRLFWDVLGDESFSPRGRPEETTPSTGTSSSTTSISQLNLCQRRAVYILGDHRFVLSLKGVFVEDNAVKFGDMIDVAEESAVFGVPAVEIEAERSVHALY